MPLFELVLTSFKLGRELSVALDHALIELRGLGCQVGKAVARRRHRLLVNFRHPGNCPGQVILKLDNRDLP